MLEMLFQKATPSGYTCWPHPARSVWRRGGRGKAAQRRRFEDAPRFGEFGREGAPGRDFDSGAKFSLYLVWREEGAEIKLSSRCLDTCPSQPAPGR